MENVTNIINEKKFNSHKLSLDNRKKISLTGVEKAVSSNENCIILQVSGIKVYVTGKNMHIEKLDVDAGIVDAEGEFESIKYGVSSSPKGFIKRIFK